MAASYASVAELTAFLPDGVTVDEPERLLARATEVLDSRVLATFDVDDTTGLPTDDAVTEALRDACCAEVEFWLEVGEEHDIAGLANRGVAVGHLRIDALPPELGPRARRILLNAGLFTPAAGAL